MIAGEASVTAKMCAFARAHHTNYAEYPICNDPLAYDLLGWSEYKLVKKKIVQILSDKCWEIPTTETWDQFLNDFISPIVLSRMKYAEDQLKSFITNSEEPIQYVICGAGLDSFLFRCPYPNLHIFEIDHPDTQKYKQQRIQELGWSIPANASLVAVDFTKHEIKEKLLEAGFHPEYRTFVAILGITYYLTLDTLAETIAQIAHLKNDSRQNHTSKQDDTPKQGDTSKQDHTSKLNTSKGSTTIVLDYPDKEIVKKGQMNQRMEALQDITDSLGEKMMGGMNYKELAVMFHQYGFHITEHVTPQIVQERYFENVDSDMKAFDNISFLTIEQD